MSIVGRKGKLSGGERIEDFLTADVFGAYRYLPLEYGLVPFLAHARDEEGRTLKGFLEASGISIEKISYARMLFWPRLQDDREPDLLVLLGSSPKQTEVALLVEAKLYSAPVSYTHLTLPTN